MIIKLSFAERLMVEIARAIYHKSKVVVFDDSGASLKENEAENLYRLINKLRMQGCGVIFVSNKIEDILKISDTISVMKAGEIVTTVSIEDVSMKYLERLVHGR